MTPAWRRILIATCLVIGIAIVALLAIIAYALLSGDDGEPAAQVAQPTETATPRPVVTRTPVVTPTPSPPPPTPTATPEPTVEPAEEPMPSPEPVVVEEQPSPPEEPAPAAEETPPPPTEEPPPPPPPTEEPPSPTPPPTPTAPPPTPTVVPLFCPPNYTYVERMGGCAADPPFCSLDPFSGDAERFLRGECRYPIVLCPVGQEFDPLQQKCVLGQGDSGTSPPEAPISKDKCAEALYEWAQSLYLSPTAELDIELWCGEPAEVYVKGSTMPISRDKCAEALYEWAQSGFLSPTAEMDVDLWC